MESIRQQRTLEWFLVPLLLLLLCAQLVFSAQSKSFTMDEVYHLFNGALWFSSDRKRLVFMGNPPLVNVLEAALPVALEDVRLPTDPAAWRATRWRDLVNGLFNPFLWQVNGERASRLVFLARLPVMGLSLFLAAGVHRWARELRGRVAGVLALLLVVFEPNLLAHGRLATTDLGVACFSLWAAYLFWRFSLRFSWRRLVLAGLALGLALSAKFSALTLLPAFAILSCWPGPAWGERRWARGVLCNLTGLFGISLIAAAILLATCRFDVSALEAEYTFQRTHLGEGHAAFLMGRYSDAGWWYYFPVAFALKTPLPLIALAVAGGVSLRRRRRDLAFLLLPPAILFGASLFSRVNIGYRYLLPVLPSVLILASGVIPPSWGSVRGEVSRLRWPKTVGHILLASLVVWYVIGTLRIYPHYLAYFNELPGGPGEGWRYLVDSNLDWGQDLPGLRTYMQERDLERVYLSWFGTAPPGQYDVDYLPLPSIFPPQGEAAHRVYHPQRPLPGVYAISATHLQGLYLPDRDTYAWFREREPTAKIGYSIFVYDVPRTGGDAVSVCLSDLSLDQVDAEVLDTFIQTNDLRLRWFDARGGLIWPNGRWDAWLLIGEGPPLDLALRERFFGSETVWARREAAEGQPSYTWVHLPAQAVASSSVPTSDGEMPVWWSPAARFTPGYERHPLSFPVDVGRRLSFLGYELLDDRPRPGDELQLLTFWRVEQPLEPALALFVHLLDVEGQVQSQHDGLSVDPVGMEGGDVFVQLHRFGLPGDVLPGEYELEAGVYQPDTMVRWDVYQGDRAVADRLLLQAVRVIPDERGG